MTKQTSAHTILFRPNCSLSKPASLRQQPTWIRGLRPKGWHLVWTNNRLLTWLWNHMLNPFICMRTHQEDFVSSNNWCGCYRIWSGLPWISGLYAMLWHNPLKCCLGQLHRWMKAWVNCTIHCSWGKCPSVLRRQQHSALSSCVSINKADYCTLISTPLVQTLIVKARGDGFPQKTICFVDSKCWHTVALPHTHTHTHTHTGPWCVTVCVMTSIRNTSNDHSRLSHFKRTLNDLRDCHVRCVPQVFWH